MAVLHESPFRIIDLTRAVAEVLPDAGMTVCCDLTKLHENILRGRPDEVLRVLESNEKTEKGEYCVVLDLHGVEIPEAGCNMGEETLESRLIEAMKAGAGLREAQELVIGQGAKRNAVKQAALTLKKLFRDT